MFSAAEISYMKWCVCKVLCISLMALSQLVSACLPSHLLNACLLTYTVARRVLSALAHTCIHTYTHSTSHYITLHYITLQYFTLHYITLHHVTWHYITLHTCMRFGVACLGILADRRCALALKSGVCTCAPMICTQ